MVPLAFHSKVLQEMGGLWETHRQLYHHALEILYRSEGAVSARRLVSGAYWVYLKAKRDTEPGQLEGIFACSCCHCYMWKLGLEGLEATCNIRSFEATRRIVILLHRLSENRLLLATTGMGPQQQTAGVSEQRW